MKRSKAIIYTLAILLILLVLIKFARPVINSLKHKDSKRTDEQLLAIFDRSYPSATQLAGEITHYQISWKSTTTELNKQELLGMLAKGDLLITVETLFEGVLDDDNVLMEVSAGKLDDRIKELANAVAGSKHKVYVRFDPDMEVPVKMYPWQYKSAPEYIKAFNYFARVFKRYAPNAKIVWGPSGYPGDNEYWPGNKEVDYVSITLGSQSENSLNVYPFAKTVPEMLRQKLHRLRFINKPVLILGSNRATKNNFQAVWLTDELNYMNQFSGTAYSVKNYFDSVAIKPVRQNLKVGVFDPAQKLLGQKNITVEHVFADWGDVQRGDFEKRFNEVINRHHDVIVTMEPWRDTTSKTDTIDLKQILSGRFDNEIKKLFGILASTKQVVYLRWMHEMEIPIHRYAWQSQDPVTYITAFRYFMQFEGGPAKNVKRVWGPAGDRGSIDFWPGSDVVDYISIAIYGLPDKNITDPNKQEAFSTIFNRKFYRMRFADKPLFITEFGVKGPVDYQDKWLADAAETIRLNPHVFGVCYFNLYDNPKAWGKIKAPDWSITPASMDGFTKLLGNHVNTGLTDSGN